MSVASTPAAANIPLATPGGTNVPTAVPEDAAALLQQQQQQQQQAAKRKLSGRYALGDFNIQRTLGTGSFGRVHLVRSKHNMRFYAIKVLKKEQVVRMKQVEHTNSERSVLSLVRHPFQIGRAHV